jgi:hypothetical protein
VWVAAVLVLIALSYTVHRMKWFTTDSLPFRKRGVATTPADTKASPAAGKSAAKKAAADSSKGKQGTAPDPGTKQDDAGGKAQVPPAGQESQKDSAVRPESKPGGDGKTVVASASAPAAASPEQGKPDTAPKAEVAPAPPPALLIRFRAPTQTRVIRKSDGAELWKYEGSAGNQQKVDISEAVTLIVTDAGAVDAEFRGRRLVLRQARRSTEARVDLK